MASTHDLILGTAGHIDHGKTALVRALTGVDTDRLEEEKRRGISIDLGFAALTIGDRRIGIVDGFGRDLGRLGDGGPVIGSTESWRFRR